MEKLRLENKIAIVTGAGSGIGLATVQAFASEGASIVMADIDEKKVNEAKQTVKVKDGAALMTAICDVSKEEQVERTVRATMDRFGRVDVIVNNAGLMVFKPLEEQVSEDWQKVLGVDLMGAFYFIKQAFLHMKPGGSIVNVSSIHAEETTPLVASYAAAKSALLSLTRSAALEGKAKGLRVNAVLPGAIDTPMLWNNPNIKAGLEVIRQGDVGKASDIANAIAFLASDEAQFIQGAGLRVDGGRLAQL